MEFTDRYQALGIPYPDPAMMCQGECEGTGWVPVKADDERYGAAWAEAEAKEPKEPMDDGWHFVKCLDCGGTGKKPAPADAIYGFMAWLTTREEEAGPFYAHHDSAPAASLVKEYCAANGWEVSPGYPENFTWPGHPGDQTMRRAPLTTGEGKSGEAGEEGEG